MKKLFRNDNFKMIFEKIITEKSKNHQIQMILSRGKHWSLGRKLIRELLNDKNNK